MWLCKEHPSLAVGCWGEGASLLLRCTCPTQAEEAMFALPEGPALQPAAHCWVAPTTPGVRGDVARLTARRPGLPLSLLLLLPKQTRGPLSGFCRAQCSLNSPPSCSHLSWLPTGVQGMLHENAILNHRPLTCAGLPSPEPLPPAWEATLKVSGRGPLGFLSARELGLETLV